MHEATEAATSVPQHLSALARANRVRLARAELKRRIADGNVQAAAVVEDCPWEAETMTFGELLLSQRSWGTKRSRKLAQALAISENKKLEALTARQRTMVAEALRDGGTPGDPGAGLTTGPLMALA
ncbi:MAG: hypothetical protein ACR2NA_13195 [Solirubrobacterales bacterium]